jgi:Eukaryotic-type carbonic anhydrase
MQLVHIKSEYYGNFEEAYNHEDAFAIISILFKVG